MINIRTETAKRTQALSKKTKKKNLIKLLMQQKNPKTLHDKMFFVFWGFLLKFIFIYFEREKRHREQGGEGQRERGRQIPKQASHYQHRV